MKKNMAKAKVKKTNSTRTAQRFERRIVEVSLQHPKLGARRLVPLLKKKRIEASAATIQNILRRHGLQNREKRMAKLEAQSKKARKAKSPPKKPSNKITDDIAEHICEISLQDPDLGAKSLAPLLEEQGIYVSSSAVYRILKHYKLQTRAKRYAKVAEITAEPVIIPKTFTEKIPPEVEGRIAEISLQNPEYGVRRLLPLLQQEEISVSVSSVFRILKRNELENRQKRFLKLEALQAPPEAELTESEFTEEDAEIMPILAVEEATEPASEPAAAIPIPPEVLTPKPADLPEQEPVVVAQAKPERARFRKPPVKPIKRRAHWLFYPLYLSLFALIGYQGFQAFQAIQFARLETRTVIAADFTPLGISGKTESPASLRPINGYRKIWERNLFSTGTVKEPESGKKIALDKLAPAKKDIGLELVGTLVADDPRLSRAVIDNRSIRKQESYREGDTVGKVKIKKILRNNVVITTAEGDELLTVEIKESGNLIKTSTYAQWPSTSSKSPLKAPGAMPAVKNPWSFNLAREELEASLGDTQQLLHGATIDPYMKGKEPAGFKIANIESESILKKMGLRNGDVISGVNGEVVTGPEQAADFFQKIAEGGEVKIKIKRRRRTKYISLNIE